MKLQPTPSRLVGVDLLRAWAILSVLAGHWLNLRVYFPLYPDPEPWELPVYAFGHYGAHGVYAFFVISGFVITRSILERDGDLIAMNVREFYARRIGRIQPLFVCNLVIGATMMLLGARGPIYGALSDILQPRFWLAIFTFWYDMNTRPHGLQWTVLWSLSVEERFYLLLPWAIYFCRTRARLIALLSVFALSYPFAWPLGYPRETIVDGIAWLAASFGLLAVGVLTALIAQHLPACSPPVRARIAAASAAAIIACTLVLPVTPWHEMLLALMVSAFILAVHEGGLFTSRVWRLPAHIGQLSYGLYLLHPMVLYLAAPFLKGLAFTIGLAIYAALCIGLAQVSWMFLEQPADRLTRRLLLRG